MIPFISLDEFRKRFKVVDPHDLSASEPTKYHDPFVERDNSTSPVDQLTSQPEDPN